MEEMRESWTDERLDDFRGDMTDFRRETKEEFVAVRREMKEEFRAVRREMKDEFAAVRREMKEEFAAVRQEMKEEFRLVHSEFGALHERFDRLQQTMIQFMGVIIVALIGLIATQL
jgi:serine/threonine protein kinase HipA of HipAB toxin-antitoxin module